MPLHTWLLYAAAVFVLTVTPGPAVLMCVTTAAHQGARRALFAALGSITAVVGIMACSSVGLGAVLAASEALFHAIKWLGVAYLLCLGVAALRSRTSSFAPQAGGPPAPLASRRGLYLRGLLVGASNPKALLFFTALLPQFVDPAAAQLPQFAVLVATFVCFELFWLMFYAHFAARLGPWLQREGRARWFNRLSGTTFIAAALLLASVRQAARG